MKPVITILSIGVLFGLLCAVCIAQTSTTENPGEQLRQYTADLQKMPDDQALREKIIKLALTLDAKPAAPSDVDELAGRAKYAIDHATTQADYVDAADAFGKASLLAPWVPDYYFNQGISFEKAQRFTDAIKCFQWYLMAAPDASDAKAVRERIGGLKFAQEKAIREAAAKNAEQQENARRQAEERARLAGVEGDWVNTMYGPANPQGIAVMIMSLRHGPSGWTVDWSTGNAANQRLAVTGGHVEWSFYDINVTRTWKTMVLDLSSDGMELVGLFDVGTVKFRRK